MGASTVNKMPFQFYGAQKVKDPKALIGGKVAIAGVGSGSHFAAKLTLKYMGLNPDGDVTYIQIGSSPERFLALRLGQIQATPLLPPDTLLAKKEKLPLLVDLSATNLTMLALVSALVSLLLKLIARSS